MKNRTGPPPTPTRQTRRNFAAGMTLFMLFIIIVLLWEFKGYVYQFFTGTL
ncbi:hypothetical protein [Sulfoacidibacillus ferrooxidans]|uniref:Uncharacterized protein n=1 Tax=Sulfoacidibacillus ferrooxidans TaxID=2005001 RepID=A0A9X1V6Q6_9BACL|nr:hypothetical protein [Sulfoacidibacillus ferrooxidans]MCI0182656.1 hypothetical protein [Sulfoacidibacillus ferrooxidans]